VSLGRHVRKASRWPGVDPSIPRIRKRTDRTTEQLCEVNKMALVSDGVRKRDLVDSVHFVVTVTYLNTTQF
jgi:hypothetical protein